MLNSKRKKLIYGVANNDCDTPVHEYEYVNIDGTIKRKQSWVCPFYSRWHDMLYRVFSETFLSNNPSYRDVRVCENWLLFSNFKNWMESQLWYDNVNHEILCLDKDILSSDSKIYSATTCIFIPQRLNKIILTRSKSRGDYPLGVSWNKNAGKYIAQCSKRYLGLFDCPYTAHRAWQEDKIRILSDCLHWYKNLPCFNSDVYHALLLRIERINQDLSLNVETIVL